MMLDAKEQTEACRELWRTLVAESIYDAYWSVRGRYRTKEEAASERGIFGWIMSDAFYVGSFVWICEALDRPVALARKNFLSILRDNAVLTKKRTRAGFKSLLEKIFS